MNLTALFDVSTQRSAVPLDRAVGDGGCDPAFANVMSRYQGNDSDSLTQGTADPGSEPVPTENDESPSGAVAPARLDANGDVVDPTSIPTMADGLGSGEVLPVSIVLDGQSLPSTVGAAAIGDNDPSTSDYRGQPVPGDDLDEIDTGEVTLLAAQPPIQPIAPTTLGGTAAWVPVPMPVVVDAGAPRQAAIAAASTVALPTGVDGGAASSVSEEIPKPSTPLLADRETPDDAFALAKAAHSLAVTRAAPATGVQTSDAADSRSGSGAGSGAGSGVGVGVGLVRVFAQAATSDGGKGPMISGTGQHGDPQGQPDDALSGAAAPRVVTARFATAVGSAAGFDPTDPQPDASTDSIRTDASTQRANTTDAARDLAPTRLGELAQQHAPRLAGELADRVLVLRSQRFDSATVILEPRDLGRIDIQVRLQADGTHISFTAQHATVRDALEGQLPRLRALLEEAGLSLGMVDVSHSGSRNGGEPSTSRSPEQAKPAAIGNIDVADSSMRWQRRIEASTIDLHA